MNDSRQLGTKEGEPCNRYYEEHGGLCDGVICYEPVDECFCHNHPPCSNCANAPLVCPECDWNSQEEEIAKANADRKLNETQEKSFIKALIDPPEFLTETKIITMNTLSYPVKKDGLDEGLKREHFKNPKALELIAALDLVTGGEQQVDAMLSEYSQMVRRFADGVKGCSVPQPEELCDLTPIPNNYCEMDQTAFDWWTGLFAAEGYGVYLNRGQGFAINIRCEPYAKQIIPQYDFIQTFAFNMRGTHYVHLFTRVLKV
ncbi:MAG: hypothetical protein ABW007_19075 [Chitinophagaceae bacterium]